MFKLSLRALRLASLAFALIATPAASMAQASGDAPTFKAAYIGNGITLHYAEQGTGTPVIFIHGSISDYDYWDDEVPFFAKHYRAIAYSRRYNFPNTNPARPGYSAAVDADDLAAFIKTLHLGKVYIVGHSYGALTTLFLASKHPELIRAMVLAEPPAVSLLRHLPGSEAKAGNAMFADIQTHMVAPMQVAFTKGDRSGGVRVFLDYVYNDKHKWENMSPSSRQATLRDVHEWDVVMTTGRLFPDIAPQVIRKITVPTLILSGAKSYQFLKMTDGELARLLPNSKRIIVKNAGHQMWYQDPALCRTATEALFQRN